LSTSKTQTNKGGRPRVDATPITLRLRPDLLDWVDTERAKLDPEPSRPEFIRITLEKNRREGAEE
jgi:hypothetical protein